MFLACIRSEIVAVKSIRKVLALQRLFRWHQKPGRAILLSKAAFIPKALRSEQVITSVTAVLLAGGKSSRMGQNKALLPFQDRPLIENVIQTLSGIFSRVVLSIHEADAFPQFSLPRIVDQYPETGPMGGIASVLESGEKNIFCVACDMPFLNTPLIEYICSLEKYDAVIPVWQEKPEVLHARYSCSLLPAFQFCLREKLYKITEAVEESQVMYLLKPEIVKFDPEGQSFRNINTPADYSLIKNE